MNKTNDIDKQIRELEQQKQTLERRRLEDQRRELMARKDILKAAGVPEAYRSDDYAGMDVGKWSFYYGYETTKCPKHKTEEACEKADCDKREWCFEGQWDEQVVARYASSELTTDQWDVVGNLLAGIGLMLNKGLLVLHAGPAKEKI